MTCDPASKVPVHPTSASFQASGPLFTRNSETRPWLPGGKSSVKSSIKSKRLVLPPMLLVAKPTIIRRAGKKARNMLNAMACEIMLQRGNTRPSIRNVRLKKRGLEAISRHYTHAVQEAASRSLGGEWRFDVDSFFRTLGLKPAVHHQGVNGTLRRMQEGAGEPADNF